MWSTLWSGRSSMCFFGFWCCFACLHILLNAGFSSNWALSSWSFHVTGRDVQKPKHKTFSSELNFSLPNWVFFLLSRKKVRFSEESSPQECIYSRFVIIHLRLWKVKANRKRRVKSSWKKGLLMKLSSMGAKCLRSIRFDSLGFPGASHHLWS